MKSTGLLVGALMLCWAAPARGADRLTDKDVKELVTKVEQGRDRFDNALEDKVKNGVIRGPNGEVNVKIFLNDFQESIDRLEERTKPDYAGSAEAGTLLRQATAIDRFFRQQSAGTRGESEWNRLATDLKMLAAAYGTEFPLADGAVVRRIGDRELEQTIDKIVRSGEELERALNSDFKTDTSTDKAARDAVVGGAKQLVKDAKELKDRVDDAEPSSGEAERVLAGAARIKAFIESHKVPASSSAWTSAGDSLRDLASAYGRTWPAK